MIVAVPAATPDTMPDAEPTEAVVASLLLHVPPVVASVSVMVLPMQTKVKPDMGAGVLNTVTDAVLKHPVAVSV